ncbi:MULTISPECIES: hypothetical protein [Methylocaldum]|jgi:hypothetical protein|uniref:hypothetical protein n=1 Tax=unclassified Methylocaldum TaxID=2622260 RepID=UPI00098B9572|nr:MULTISPECIES: hypothetical protein [unclassified Methylocaldum]MBP1152723.1 hypothetical protein [Methylocaldum sp. RMAD-M]MDV3242682.1 hypothetical protein [Methylocaldum sp.]MVF20409.1 hypothetical protein [Methylocaldum sp. BRCS4]
MRKMMFSVSMLATMMIAAPAIASDFHALGEIKGATPLQDQVLATVEGGSTCGIGGASTGGQPDGGVCLISFISHPTGASVGFAVTNQLPVTGANFLQVTGL